MILVFGGGGQLAQELARLASRRNIPLVALTRDSADIADSAAVDPVLQDYRPSLVVNAAAYTNVDQAEDDYEEAHRSNADGPACLALACALADIPLLHVSTDYVFDGSKRDPYVETDPIAPINAYGRTKAAGEAAIRLVATKHIILRTSWIFGEFGRNFLKTILRAASERRELRVVSDQRGCPTSTGDLAFAILSIAPLMMAREAVWGTYHYCGAGVTNWHEFASAIVGAQAPMTGHTPAVIPIATRDYPTKARRPANSALDSSLFTKTFGIEPSPWLEECTTVTRALLSA